MKRIIVLGGLGQFGRTAAEELRRFGLPCIAASRRPNAELQIDANDSGSIHTLIQHGDIVLDAAGPFSERSRALVESAIEIGFDIVDINDDLRYAEALLALAPQIEVAGIRVLSSASTVSAVAAAILADSGLTPTRLTAFLAPASRHTSNPGAARSLIGSVGRPIRILREGKVQERLGWSNPREFPLPTPLRTIHARLFESADALLLPRCWPSLRDVAMYVDTNTPGVNQLLRLAARFPLIRRLLERQAALGTRIARAIGSNAGGIGYEIEDVHGHVARYAIVAAENSFVTAVAPAVLAIRALAGNRFPYRGLVQANQQVSPDELFAYLRSHNIAVTRMATS